MIKTKRSLPLLAVLMAIVGYFLPFAGAQAQKVERLNFGGGPPSGVFGIFATGIGTYL